MASCNRRSKNPKRILSLISLIGAHVFLFSGALTGRQARAESPPHEPAGKPASKPASKPNLSTQIYEEDSQQETFTDVVRFVRDGDGYTEIIFTKRAGFYIAPSDESSLEKLQASHSKKTPVQVTVDDKTSRILKVPATKAADPNK